MPLSFPLPPALRSGPRPVAPPRAGLAAQGSIAAVSRHPRARVRLARLLPRLRAGLGSALVGVLLTWSGAALLPPARAATPTPAQLQALEAALNGQDPAALQALLQPGPGLNPALLERRWSALRQQFSNARWQISPGAPTQAGQPTVNLRVVGSRSEAGTTYRLSAEQQLELHSDGQRIQAENLLREQTILRSGDTDLPVSVLIPDAVLTGQRYDVDVIFDDPLDGAVVAGGVQALTAQQVAAMESPPLEFSVLGGGGLFKTVQAPFLPGSQTWAVLLVHPRGVVSATKRVRVVSDRAGLLP